MTFEELKAEETKHFTAFILEMSKSDVGVWVSFWSRSAFLLDCRSGVGIWN